MTIQQLQYILEVQRTGTIAQAAKNLYVSNSGVSNAINALESELGINTFANRHAVTLRACFFAPRTGHTPKIRRDLSC